MANIEFSGATVTSARNISGLNAMHSLLLARVFVGGRCSPAMEGMLVGGGHHLMVTT